MDKLANLGRRSFLTAALAPVPAAALAIDVASPAPAATAAVASFIFNVRKYGATGNGTADDTAAFKAAISALNASAHGGTLYIPTGVYRVTATLTLNPAGAVQIAGDGSSSVILWGFDGNLLSWAADATECTVRDLKVMPSVTVSTASAVLSFAGALVRSSFLNLLFEQNGSLLIGSGVAAPGLVDTTSFINCVQFGISGTGLLLGHGSEVRVIGGRIIGPAQRTSTGIHLTGNNGGVHVIGTDIISHATGMLIENTSGAGSNREIFVTHATFDSCFQGLAIADASYVSIAGCWAASCDHDNIYVGFGAPILVISGGTIFNGGVSSTDPLGGNGLTVNSGVFLLTGVAVRNNREKGIWVANSSTAEYSIASCRVSDNGTGAICMGSNYIVTGNIFERNGPSSFSGSGFLKTNNIGV